MKWIVWVVFVMFSCTECFSAPVKTKEAFADAIRAAFEAKDVQALSALTWWHGASEEDRKRSEQDFAKEFEKVRPVTGVFFEPLPFGYRDVQICLGKRVEPTHPASGRVKVKCEIDKTTGSDGPWLAYAVIEGTYFLISAKVSDLGWKGPRDTSFNVNVSGTGSVKVHVKYNASGVDQETDVAFEVTPPSTALYGFHCQYVDEVMLTSEDPNADVQLILWDGSGEKFAPFYKSDPLKGKGQIHYKKDSH